MKLRRIHQAVLLLLAIHLLPGPAIAQSIAITAVPGQSANIVIGPALYHVSEQIYTDAEIGNQLFTTPSTAINHIDFSVFAVGSVTTVSQFNLYLKEVASNVTSFSSNSDSYSLAGYTLVYSGPYTAAATGWAGVDLSTPFQRTPGSNLQLLIERTDGVAHGSYSFNATRGSNGDGLVNSSRRVNTNTLPAPGTTILNTLSPFRAQVQLRHINQQDAAVSAVYTLGKLPVPYAVPHTISTHIINNGAAALSNLPVTLQISGANSFTDQQVISTLLPGAAVTVSFQAFTPVNTGINEVTVSLPPDDFPVDNQRSLQQEISNNAYNYAYSTTPTSAVGFNNATGDIAALFTTGTPTTVNQLGVYFTAGGQPFRLAIWDKSGQGKPGTLLWQSDELISTPGIFTLPVLPAVAVTDSFYAGVRQTGTINVQFAYQLESPVRPSVFYYSTPAGTGAWTDFAPANPFRFMIEPRLTLANDVGISRISNPAGGSTVDRCGIYPQATVTNFGAVSQPVPFEVAFSIRRAGSILYNSTRNLNLNSGASASVVFDAFTSPSAGNDTAEVITRLSGDAAANNDTVRSQYSTGNFSYADSSSSTDGYQYANSTPCASPAPRQPVYQWTDARQQEINWGSNGDDSVLSAPVTLPFPFPFFGTVYTQLWICSNGWVSFSDPSALPAAVQRTPVSIPSAGGIENYIAGILADLDLTPGIYPDAHTYIGGDGSRFVITFWHAHRHGSADEYISFQIILQPGGDIIVQYNEAETSSPYPVGITQFCSAGIENANGSKGVLYRLAGSRGSIFGSPLAVQYYPRPGSVIPVQWGDFNVRHNGQSHLLNWNTLQEINSSRFGVERSTDGVTYTTIGEINAAGNSARGERYHFTDNHPVPGINYYRIAETGRDQRRHYSAVRQIIYRGKATLQLHPNPVSALLTIRWKQAVAGRCTLTISDPGGRQLVQEQFYSVPGNSIRQVNCSQLPAGTYLLRLTGNQEVYTATFRCN